MTLSYLEGQAADEIVSALDDRTAYSLGVEAGKTLKLLHGIPVQTPKQSWWEKYSAKIPKKIERIRSCELSLPQREMLIGYIEEHIALVKNRRQVFSHSDYHVGNMIVNGGKVSIIDFDKNTISDPYDEFKPFCWNVFANEYFETGLINGYFGSNIPDDFFPVLALYAAESLISHLPWAITFGQQEIETAYRVIDSTLRWYDNFTLTVPTWYKGILEF